MKIMVAADLAEGDPGRHRSELVGRRDQVGSQCVDGPVVAHADPAERFAAQLAEQQAVAVDPFLLGPRQDRETTGGRAIVSAPGLPPPHRSVL